MLVGKCREWRTGDMRISIAILLPYGIEKEHVFATSEEGTMYQVTIQWPSVLTDVNMLCKMYRGFQKSRNFALLMNMDQFSWLRSLQYLLKILDFNVPISTSSIHLYFL